MAIYRRLSSLGIGWAFLAIAVLFFAWGFVSANNDPLIVAVRSAYGLNYTEALLIQIVFFVTSGLVALPAAAFVERVGPVRSILLSLALMALGCLGVAMVVRLGAYVLVLSSLFVLACGITSLQVAANPLAVALGPADSGPFRLNLAQTLNSIGVVMGVHFGANVVLSPVLDTTVQTGPSDGAMPPMLVGVSHAYFLIATALIFLAIFMGLIGRRLPQTKRREPAPIMAALRSRWVIAGALAIGLYVGAEVAIGSIMINFLHQHDVLDLSLVDGGRYLANYYWGGALVGRIVGTLLLVRVPAERLLAFCALCAALLCVTVFMTTGPVAAAAALSVGLFNSIMFPTIFSLTLQRAGVSSAATSGVLCLAITGGAILPLMVGRIADHYSLSAAFVIPAMAYAVIFVFGLSSQRARNAFSAN